MISSQRSSSQFAAFLPNRKQTCDVRKYCTCGLVKRLGDSVILLITIIDYFIRIGFTVWSFGGWRRRIELLQRQFSHLDLGQGYFVRRIVIGNKVPFEAARSRHVTIVLHLLSGVEFLVVRLARWTAATTCWVLTENTNSTFCPFCQQNTLFCHFFLLFLFTLSSVALMVNTGEY